MRPSQEHHSCIGQDDFARRSVKESRLYDGFKAQNGLADLLLTQIELRSRLVEAETLGHRKEASQVPEFKERGTRAHRTSGRSQSPKSLDTGPMLRLCNADG